MVVLTRRSVSRRNRPAHAFADVLGLPVVCDRRLRERSFGEWEGLTALRSKPWPLRTTLLEAPHWRGNQTRVESRAEVGKRGADAVRALVCDSAYADDTPTTLMLVTHGSWITATISNLLELDPDGMNALGGMRNACWCRLKVRHSVNGHPHRTSPVWGVGGNTTRLPPSPTAPTGRTGRPICEDRTCQVGSQSSGDGSTMPKTPLANSTVGLD